MKNSMTKVRISNLPKPFKKRLVLRGCSSKCAFGEPLLQVSNSDFKSWRAATARARGTGLGAVSEILCARRELHTGHPNQVGCIHNVAVPQLRDACDSKYRRAFQCKAYDAFRSELPNLFSKLGRLPEAVWRFGLVPLSPDPWPFLQHLHQTPLEFSFPSLMDSLDIFVDGSCFWPQDRLFSIAGAAAIVADMTCNGEGVIRSQSCQELNSPSITPRYLPSC